VDLRLKWLRCKKTLQSRTSDCQGQGCQGL
jgi:hypothetical protein